MLFEAYYSPLRDAGWWLDTQDFGDAIFDLWPPETIAAMLVRARDKLREGSGRSVAFAALLVGRLGDADDFALLVAAFDRELERDGGKALEARWTVEWQRVLPLSYLLGGCFAAVQRGAVLTESSRTPAEQRIADHLRPSQAEKR